MILKRSSFPVQPAGNKKYKDDFHKLRGLERESAQRNIDLRPVDILAQDQNYQKQQHARPGIEPSPLI